MIALQLMTVAICFYESHLLYSLLYPACSIRVRHRLPVLLLVMAVQITKQFILGGGLFSWLFGAGIGLACFSLYFKGYFALRVLLVFVFNCMMFLVDIVTYIVLLYLCETQFVGTLANYPQLTVMGQAVSRVLLALPISGVKWMVRKFTDYGELEVGGSKWAVYAIPPLLAGILIYTAFPTGLQPDHDTVILLCTVCMLTLAACGLGLAIYRGQRRMHD